MARQNTPTEEYNVETDHFWGRSTWCTLIRQTLDGISSPDDVHEGYTRNLSYPPAELTITSSDDITFMWCYALDETVVRICTTVRAFESLETQIASDAVWMERWMKEVISRWQGPEDRICRVYGFRELTLTEEPLYNGVLIFRVLPWRSPLRMEYLKVRK